jgi:hypothetical protein
MSGKAWLTTAFVIGSSLAIPASSAAQVPTQDSAVGSGSVVFDFPSFSFNVSSGPSGENPSGSATAVYAGQTLVAASITCLTVSGNTATFAGTLEPNTFGFVTFKITVVDNGSTGDLFNAEAGPPPAPSCSTPVSSFSPGGALLTGNITVTDAQPPPPLPTSKDQCQNGGWRSFPGFKNQGDCVSFVATGGKNPPAGP